LSTPGENAEKRVDGNRSDPTTGKLIQMRHRTSVWLEALAHTKLAA
jgi:hypothetical protein